MLNKKIISFILSIVLVSVSIFPLFSIRIFADETVTVTNPEFNNAGIHEDLTAPHSDSISFEYLFDKSQYGDKTATVLYMREKLVEHPSSITVYWVSDTKLSGEDRKSLFYEAMEHTGNPKQGDSLGRAWNSFGLSSQYYIYDNKYYYDITFNIVWFTTAAQELELDLAVNALLAELDLFDKSDFEKIKGVYDYICANITYDHTNLNTPSYKLKYTAYAALINKTSVCQGYAVLLYRLLLELGVDCRYISGRSNSGAHGWNIVKLDGLYYNVDATWDAGLSSYSYFLRNQNTFSNHYRNSEYLTDEFMTSYPMSPTSYVVKVGASGRLNDNVTWVLDENTGILNINGTGHMYSDSQGVSWEEYGENICGAIMSDNIYNIGYTPFWRCSNIVFIYLSSSLQNISSYAFYRCLSLESITIPSTVNTIYLNAFRDCSALRFMHFKGCPENVYDPDEYTEFVASALYFDDVSLITKLLSNGALQTVFDNAQSIAVPQGSEVSAFITETFTKTSSVSYGGKTYTLYSDHVCEYELRSFSDGRRENSYNECTTCAARTASEVCDHSYNTSVILPSCVNEGYTVYICTKCEHSYTDSITSPLGHAYISTVVPPTTAAQGYTEHTCKRCSDSYKDTYTDPLPAYTSGDINGDGKVNNLDAARLMQYIAGWDVDYVEAALDVNGDGKVNNLDAARLMQYIAGWDVEIH